MRIVLSLIACISFSIYSVLHAQQSSLVHYGTDGKLEYNTFANTGQTNSQNRIPDFSFAGFKGGGVSLPVLPVVETISPVEGDALSLIQSAIDRVSALTPDANGFRGAILLKAGRYEINGSLFLRADGVVLRGEGQNTAEDKGTELFASARIQHDFIQLKGNETSSEGYSESVIDTKRYPPAGQWQEFDVTDGVAEQVEGDKIISFHLTADVNQYVSYSSREDAALSPYLMVRIASAVPGQPDSIKLIPNADTYVRGGTYAKDNFGFENSIAVKNAGINNNVTREAFLKFDLSNIKDSVQSAVLKLFTKKDLEGDPAAIKTVNILVSVLGDDSWDEMTLTYETMPVQGGTADARKISSSYVPVGAVNFDIENASGLAVGDTIRVNRTPNDKWINDLAMAQYGWTASEYKVSYERIITGISGNTITVNIPLVQAIEEQYGGGEVVRVSIKGRIRNCGIENMMLTSYYASNTDENHGWSAITLTHSTDCWVKKVTARYFGYSCVGLYWAYNTTVEECAQLDPKSITTGSRKYSFYIDKGSFNLFQRCYTRGGRHDFVTGSRVAGPNVFADCYSKETYADIGPHHRYATGILFDNIRGGEIRVQNRKDMGSGHGWAGAQTMFWNCHSDVSEFKVESPVGAMNWGIGCEGLVKNGAGFWESWGTQVVPRSLYYQQLNDRLGNAAVENVTIPEQRLGGIWNALSKWAGLGELSAVTATELGSEQLPVGFSLEQNFPNPFNPETTIKYSIPIAVGKANFAFPARVSLKIYDILGCEMATLVDETKSPGNYEIKFNGSSLPSGIYFCRMGSGNYSAVKKMLLLK